MNAGAGHAVTLARLAVSGTARRTVFQLRWSGPVLLAGSLLALLLWQPVREMGGVAAAGLALWLHVPCFFWTAAVLAAGLDSWPTFGRGQSGADHVLRLRVGPLHGCGAASIAVLAVLAAGLAALGVAFALAAGIGPGRAHLEVPPARADLAVLNGSQGTVALQAPDRRVEELRLRPLAIARGAGPLLPTAIEVRAGGAALNPQPIPVQGSDELVRIEFSPRLLTDLEVRAVGEVGLPLWFGEGRVVALSADSWPATVNCAAACLSYVLPAALALALVCCTGPFLGLPVASILALATLLLTAVAGWAPTGDAVQSVVLGRRVVGPDLWSRSLPSLSAAILAIICSMQTRRRSIA